MYDLVQIEKKYFCVLSQTELFAHVRSLNMKRSNVYCQTECNVCALLHWAKNIMLSLKPKWTHAYCLLSRTDMSTVSQIENNECILSLTLKVMHYVKKK
jgi:hypothetical protein